MKPPRAGLGRPLGSRNKRTLEFIAVLEARGFNVADALIWVYTQAQEKYKEYAEKVESGRYSPMEDQSAKFLKIAGDMAKELASYTQPKLKSIEQTKPNPLSDLTPKEKLEAMKQAVLMLEMEVKASGPGAT